MIVRFCKPRLILKDASHELDAAFMTLMMFALAVCVELNDAV